MGSPSQQSFHASGLGEEVHGHPNPYSISGAKVVASRLAQSPPRRATAVDSNLADFSGTPRHLAHRAKTRDEVLKSGAKLQTEHAQLKSKCAALAKELELRKDVVLAVERERDTVADLVRQLREIIDEEQQARRKLTERLETVAPELDAHKAAVSAAQQRHAILQAEHKSLAALTRALQEQLKQQAAATAQLLLRAQKAETRADEDRAETDRAREASAKAAAAALVASAQLPAAEANTSMLQASWQAEKEQLEARAERSQKAAESKQEDEAKEIEKRIEQAAELSALKQAKMSVEEKLRSAQAQLDEGCGETMAQKAQQHDRTEERLREVHQRAEAAERRTQALEARLQAVADEKLQEKLAVLNAEQRAAEEVLKLSNGRWEAERAQLLQRIAQLEAQVEQLDVVRLARDELQAVRASGQQQQERERRLWERNALLEVQVEVAKKQQQGAERTEARLSELSSAFTQLGGGKGAGRGEADKTSAEVVHALLNFQGSLSAGAAVNSAGVRQALPTYLALPT